MPLKCAVRFIIWKMARLSSYNQDNFYLHIKGFFDISMSGKSLFILDTDKLHIET